MKTNLELMSELQGNLQGKKDEEIHVTISEMIKKYEDIWSIGYKITYKRCLITDPNDQSNLIWIVNAFPTDLTIETGRTKCEHCEEYFLKTREWSKFCSAACRQAAFRAHNEAKYEREKMEADEVAAKHGWRKVHNTPKKEEVYKEWILSLLDNAEDLKERFLVEVGDKGLEKNDEGYWSVDYED